MLRQDESDEMLSRGFKDQIYDVYRYLPPELQVTHSHSVCVCVSLSLCVDGDFAALHLGLVVIWFSNENLCYGSCVPDAGL